MKLVRKISEETEYLYNFKFHPLPKVFILTKGKIVTLLWRNLADATLIERSRLHHPQ